MSKVAVLGLTASLLLPSSLAFAKEYTEIVWQKKVTGLQGVAVGVDHLARTVVAGTQYQNDFDSLVRVVAYGANGSTGYSAAIDAAPGALDRVEDAAIDPVSGGLVFTGSTRDAAQETSIRTVKLDANGQVVWAVEAGPGSGIDLAVDDLGNVYVAASAWSDAGYGLLTLAYAGDGTLRWSASLPDESPSDFRHGLAVDSAGHVYVAGGQHVVSYDANGQPRWVIERQVSAIALDDDENLVVTAPVAGTDLVNDAGALLWHHATGGTHVAVAVTGDVFVAGLYVKGFSTADWDLDVTRFSPAGALVWTRRYDGGAQDSPAGLATDAAGAIYVVAHSESRKGLLQVFSPDYFAVKYDRAGSKQWEARLGTGLPATAIAVGADGRVTLTGLAGTTVQYRQKPCSWWIPACW